MHGTEHEVLLLLKKGRRSVMRAVYSHALFVGLSLLLQLGLLFLIFRFLQDHILYAFGGYFLLSFAVLLVVVNRTGTPEIQLSWAVLILALPVFGSLFYLFVDLQPGYRLLNLGLQNQISQSKALVPRQSPSPQAEIRKTDPGAANLVGYLERYAFLPAQSGTRVRYFPQGELLFEEMLVRLKNARSFIFLEYFAISEGYMWGSILKVLEAKAKEGLDVRVLYDGTCTMALLPYRYHRQLEALGIQCQVFAPILPVLSTHYNNRDHRKILVVDGQFGFTGGVNIEDCYINRQPRYGHWKDAGVMLEGPGVDNLTTLFLQMWNLYAAPQDPKTAYAPFLGQCTALPDAPGFVLPYGDNPLNGERVGETVYLDMIHRARRCIRIMTPYLILNATMRSALTCAAKRGVEVTLFLPHIPDKPYAFALAKSHYPELVRAGVQIFEYVPGFLHSKNMVVDGTEAVSGTINFDYRSLYLHFECAVYMYGCPAIAQMEKDMQDTLLVSRQITLEEALHPSRGLRIAGRLLKLFAPLM